MEQRLCPCGTALQPSQARYCSKPCRIDGMRHAKASKPAQAQEYVPEARMDAEEIPPYELPPVPEYVNAEHRRMSAEMVASIPEDLRNLRIRSEPASDWRRPPEALAAMQSWHGRKPL